MDDEVAKLLQNSMFIVDEDYDDDEQTLSDPLEVRSDPEDDELERAVAGESMGAEGGLSFRSLLEDPGQAAVPAAEAQVFRPMAQFGHKADAVAARRAQDRRSSLSSSDKPKRRSRSSLRRHSNERDIAHRIICKEAEIQSLFIGSSETGFCKNCNSLVRVVGHYVTHVDDPELEDPGPERMSPRYREPTPSPTHRRALRDYVGGRGPTEAPPLTSEEAAAMSLSTFESYAGQDTLLVQESGDLASLSFGNLASAAVPYELSGYGPAGTSYASGYGPAATSYASDAIPSASRVSPARLQDSGSSAGRFLEPPRVSPRSEDPRRSSRELRREARGSSSSKKKSKKHKRKD